MENVKLLLGHGVDVEKADNEGNTFLVMLLSWPILLTSVTELLLQRTTWRYTQKPKSANCFTGSRSRYDKSFAFAGFSPLHVAAERGTLEIVQLIFHRVQNLELPNVYGTAPLSLASKSNSPDVGKRSFGRFSLTGILHMKKFRFAFPVLFSV